MFIELYQLCSEKSGKDFFYVNDHLPMHVHIEKDSATAKFDIFPLALIISKGFKAIELSLIRKLVEKNSIII